MSVAVFALKAGGGLSYLLTQKPGLPRKAALSIGFMIMYGLIFLVSGWILSSVDLTRHVDTLQAFFKSGMTLHFILAFLMAAWGLHLLMKSHDNKKASRAWILLVVPCPVCFSVILLSCAFTCALYPGNCLVFWGLYGGFILVSLSVALLFSVFLKKSTSNPAGNFLGTLMLYIAGYFMLSVIIIPQFGDLEQIYRLSMDPDPLTFSQRQLTVFIICLAALVSGFLYRFTLLPKRD